MFGEAILQFQIHVGEPQKSLIFKVILPSEVTLVSWAVCTVAADESTTRGTGLRFCASK
jgi:hypothetical protein